MGIGTTPEGGFGLKVDILAKIAGLPQADADRLVAEAHRICPYSNATRNNIEVNVKAVAV